MPEQRKVSFDTWVQEFVVDSETKEVVQKYFLDKRMSDEEQQKMAEMEKKEPLRCDEDF